MWRLNQPCVTTPVTQTLPHYDHTGESYCQKPQHHTVSWQREGKNQKTCLTGCSAL